MYFSKKKNLSIESVMQRYVFVQLMIGSVQNSFDGINLKGLEIDVEIRAYALDTQ